MIKFTTIEEIFVSAPVLGAPFAPLTVGAPIVIEFAFHPAPPAALLRRHRSSVWALRTIQF